MYFWIVFNSFRISNRKYIIVMYVNFYYILFFNLKNNIQKCFQNMIFFIKKTVCFKILYIYLFTITINIFDRIYFFKFLLIVFFLLNCIPSEYKRWFFWTFFLNVFFLYLVEILKFDLTCLFIFLGLIEFIY